MPFKNYLLFTLIFFLISCQGGDKEKKLPVVTPPVVTPPPPVPDKKPNVIVIFTDDQGFSDLGVQNVLSDVKTPNIDQLAANGVRMTNGYVTAP